MAIELAMAIESAEKDTLHMRGTQESTVVYSQSDTVTGKSTGSRPQTLVCYRCGGNHLAPCCCFLDAECRLCKKTGHIAKVCCSKLGKERRSPRALVSHFVEEEQADCTAEDVYTVFTLTGHAEPPLIVDVELCGKKMSMEIDTGVSISIMSERTYDSLINAGLDVPLENSTTALRIYSGESLPVLGRLMVDFKVDQQVCKLPLTIIKGVGPTLLGRDWLSKLKLNWSKIHLLSQPNTLMETLDRFNALFKKGLGILIGMKAKLFSKDGFRPKFFKPRSLPYVLRSKVGLELDRLQREKVLTPVQFSEWAAPIVPVVKRDKSIRICGDFKLTVNQVSHLESYPLPHVEDLFAALTGGTVFTKLDLSQAYLQVEVDDICKKYLTVNTHKGLFQFNRLPFRVSLAPAIFQRLMDSLLQGLERYLFTLMIFWLQGVMRIFICRT